MTHNRRLGAATSAVVMGTLLLAGANVRFASAATLEEVAHCRIIAPIRERMACFKSLKLGHHAKLSPEDRTKAEEPTTPKPEGQESIQTSRSHPLTAVDAVVLNAKPRAPALSHRAPAAVELSSTLRRDETAVMQVLPTTTDRPISTGTSQSGRAEIDQAASAPAGPITGRPFLLEPPQKEIGEQVRPEVQMTPVRAIEPTRTDDPATTGSIDRGDPVGRPLCVDQDALLAMLSASLLTSEPEKATTEGCQIIPEDAQVTRLERYPSVFSIVRIVRVKITSLTRPELTTGFTIETGR